MSFDSFEIDPALLAGVRDLGFEQPTDIQQDAIPWGLEGRDVLACAMTGSGKTAAFGLPILERLLGLPAGKTRALILSPTRELASQIEEHLAELGAHTSIRVASIYGGVAYEPQEKAFRDGYEILVATPGRLIDHLRRPYANLDDVEVLVLDEADRMLDMGFIPDVRRILQQVPKERQTLFFSATLPAPIVRLANDMLRDPVTINLERKSLPAEGVRQAAYPVRHELKPALLLHLLEKHQVGSALVFCRTRDRADQVGEYLRRAGEKVAVIHGDRTQQHRTKAMDAFKKGNYRVLVATDVAARGIDIEELDVVVNLDVPSAAEDYIHRVGRTARAGATGDAWTFVAARELADLHLIEKSIGKKIERIRPEDFDYTPASLSAISRPPVAVEVPVLDAVDDEDGEEGAEGATAAEPASEPETGEAATSAGGTATAAETTVAVEEAPPARRRPTRRKAAAGDDAEAVAGGGKAASTASGKSEESVANEGIPSTEVTTTSEESSVTEKQTTTRRGRRTASPAALDETEEAAASDTPATDGDGGDDAEAADKPTGRAVKPPAGRGRAPREKKAAKPASSAGVAGGVRRPWFLAPLEEDELAAIELELASEPELIEEEDDVDTAATERPAADREASRSAEPAEERSRSGRGRGGRGRGGRGRREEPAAAAAGGRRERAAEPARPAAAERDADGARRRDRRPADETTGRRPRRGSGQPAPAGEAASAAAGVVERFARLRARREGDRLSREVVGEVEGSGRAGGEGGSRRGGGARGGRSEAPPEGDRERRAAGGGRGRGGRRGGEGRRGGGGGRSAPETAPATRGDAPRGDGRGPRFGAARAADVHPPAATGRRPRPIAEGEAEEQPPSWWSGGPSHGETPGGRRPDSRRPAHSRAAEALAAAAGADPPRDEGEAVTTPSAEPAPRAARRPAAGGGRSGGRRREGATDRAVGEGAGERAGERAGEPADEPAVQAEEASAARSGSPALERFAALRARRAKRGGGEADRS